MAILLLHGALGASEQLITLQELLERSGAAVFTPNFSGHGGEPFSASGFSIEVFAEDALKFLNDKKIESADIFGYSMGGYVAVQLAHKHPERVHSVITLGTKFDWSEASASREIQKLNPEKIKEKIPAFARLLEHRHAPNDWVELLKKTAAMMEHLGQQPLLSEKIIATVQQRMLIMLGDRDDMADRAYSEFIATCLPDGQFRLLHDTPHPLEKVDHEKLAAIITGFLS